MQNSAACRTTGGRTFLAGVEFLSANISAGHPNPRRIKALVAMSHPSHLSHLHAKGGKGENPVYRPVGRSIATFRPLVDGAADRRLAEGAVGVCQAGRATGRLPATIRLLVDMGGRPVGALPPHR